MHVVYPAVIAALLFSIGVYGVLARRNTILVLMSVELMLNAVNLNLVAFDVWLRDALHGGQVLTLFVIVIAAAEVGLGLAIVLAVFRGRGTIALDRLTLLSERAPRNGSSLTYAGESASSGTGEQVADTSARDGDAALGGNAEVRGEAAGASGAAGGAGNGPGVRGEAADFPGAEDVGGIGTGAPGAAGATGAGESAGSEARAGDEEGFGRGEGRP